MALAEPQAAPRAFATEETRHQLVMSYRSLPLGLQRGSQLVGEGEGSEPSQLPARYFNVFHRVSFSQRRLDLTLQPSEKVHFLSGGTSNQVDYSAKQWSLLALVLLPWGTGVGGKLVTVYSFVPFGF